MKGWAQLKDAFWASVEGGPEERRRRSEELRAIDPALVETLDALLAADADGKPMIPLDDPGPEPASRPTRGRASR